MRCSRSRWSSPGWWVAILLLIWYSAPGFAQQSLQDDALRAELAATAEKLVTPERCQECHASEFDVWEMTTHATGFGEAA